MKTITCSGVCLFLSCVLLLSCAPSPEQYAGATATLMRAQNAATADALDNQIRATAAAGQANATATAVAVIVQATSTSIAQQALATQTAVPHNAGLTQSRAENENARSWTLTFFLLGIAVAAIVFSFAVGEWMQTRAKMVSPTRSGQMPAMWAQGTLTDPARMIGPSVTMPQRDLVWQIYRAVHYFKTGEMLALPEPKVHTTDAGATADQLLLAAQAAQATAATAAMFQPGNNNADRGARLELTRKAGLQDPWGRQITAPQTRVLVQGDSAIEIIAQQLGGQMPKELLEQQSAFPAPPTAVLPDSGSQTMTDEEWAGIQSPESAMRPTEDK